MIYFWIHNSFQRSQSGEDMNELPKANNIEVISEAEWGQHRLHLQRMRWVELGKQAGQRIDERKQEVKELLECC